jgi:NADH:ubiquinone oxidoreductase subunit K
MAYINVDYIILSITLLAIGIYGLLVKRNLLKVLISIELITIAASMNFLLLAIPTGPSADVALGQTLLILSFATDSCVTAILLAVLIVATKKYGTWDLQTLGALIGAEPHEAGRILETARGEEDVEEAYAVPGSTSTNGGAEQ